MYSMRLVRFLKDWTLPVSIGLGIIIYFVFAEIPELEPVCEWFLPLSRPILPSFMFLILFTVFCKVDFKKLRPVKWQMWVAIQQVVFVLLIVGYRWSVVGLLIVQLRANSTNNQTTKQPDN